MKAPANAEDIRRTKRKFCSIEKEYGLPYQLHLAKWNWWRDKVFDRVKNVNKYEVMYDLEVNYEQMPKYMKIVEILQAAEQEFVKSDFYQQVYQAYAFKKLKQSK